MAFAVGVLALAEHGGLLGILTFFAGVVAVGSWALYQKGRRDRKPSASEMNLYAALGCERCVEQALRRHDAIDRALDAVTACPEDAELHHELGQLYEEEGELEMALSEYRLADELANGNDSKPEVPEFRADCERVVKLLGDQHAPLSE
jgi:tetratricopeptide (TPR) repeat protein